MLFDTWGGVLTPTQYAEFSLRYMAEIVAALTREADGRRVPNIVFTKGGGGMLAKIAAIGCDAVGVDWTTDLAAARRAVGGPGRVAGQSGPVGSVRRARNAARRNVARAREFRRRERACLQLGARHHARCGPRSAWRCWSTQCAITPSLDIFKRSPAAGAVAAGGCRLRRECWRHATHRAMRGARSCPRWLFGSSVRKYTCFGTL